LPAGLPPSLVRFTPEARTNWHSHAVGQTLHLTDGIGLVATRDGTVIRMRAGDTVYTPPGEEHKLIGDFVPKLVSLTDDVLFGDIWPRPELAPRDRSLITHGSIDQLRAHLGIAKTNGLTETELKEVIIHLAFYAGWPRAMSAITIAKDVFTD
jgi:4-carboxymuconolactone decarboxylase